MINVRMQESQVQKLSPKIIVAGIGGAGGNAVNNMIQAGLEGVEFIVCNTDAQALEGCVGEHKVQLGLSVTGGLGAGARPEIGRAAAEESIDQVIAHFEGANMAFITGGMGGGTCTGAAPVIAKAARDMGILTVGVVTKPFHFEGTHRMRQAERGIQEMQEYVDTLIVIPNQNLFRVANEKTTFAEAFRMADGVLQSGVRGVTDLMVMPGLINLDFADIRTAMQEMGKAMMGTGEASGERRALEAAEAAISNPLLDDVSMKGARGVIINITGGYDMTLFEADEAANRVRDEVDPNANIIVGSTFEEKLDGVMRISVVATGIAVEERQTDDEGAAEYGNVWGGPTPQATRGTSGNTAGVWRPSQRPAMPASQPQSVPASAKASVSAPQAQGQARTAADEPDSDMFDQHSFDSSVHEQNAPVESPEQKGDVNTHARADRQRHGFRQGNVFIPPLPVDAAHMGGSEDAGAVSPQSREPVQEESYAAEQARTTVVEEEQVVYEDVELRAETQADTAQSEPPRSLSLTPPRPGQGSEDRKKRSPSLIERITGAMRPHHEDDDQHAQGGNATQAEGHAPNIPPVRAKRQSGGQGSAVQGQLAIDQPQSRPQQSHDEDLDIPAFLRRQAN